MRDFEDEVVEAYSTSDFSLQGSHMSMRDLLLLWAADGRDLRENGGCNVLVSREDLELICPEIEKDNNAIFVAIAPKVLLTVLSFDEIPLKKGECILYTHDYKKFSKKLVLE